MPTKPKKYKKLTRTEKAFNKEFKEKLIAEGVLPPPKPKLNRKKFIMEAKKEFSEMKSFDDIRYLYEAIGWMLPGIERKYAKVTPEQVGVAKLLKISVELGKFYRKKKDNGETTYNPVDLYKDIINPILKL